MFVLQSVGKLWTRCQKLAYTLLNKLSSRNEPLLMPGDRVSHELLYITCWGDSAFFFLSCYIMRFSLNSEMTAKNADYLNININISIFFRSAS